MAGFGIPPIVPDIPDFPIGITYLGTPVYSSLIFNTAKIVDDPSTEIIEAQVIPLLNLETVLFKVSKRKNIVLTEVQNRVGTVKEYISDADYEISVSGAIVDPIGLSAPTNAAILLDRHLSLGQPLEVASSFLNTFEINTVVVLDYNINEIAGMRNQYDFNIKMISDTPIELEVKNEST